MASVAVAAATRLSVRWLRADGLWWTAVTVVLALAVVLGAIAVDGNRSGLAAATVGGCVVVLAVLASIDVRTRRIPNAIVYPMIGIALGLALIDTERSLMGALAGATVATSPFLIAFWVLPRRSFGNRRQHKPSPKGGMDDVRWAGVIGATAMLLAGLAQVEQSSAGAIAAATVAGVAFLPLFFNSRQSMSQSQGRAPGNAARGMGGGDVKLAALLGAVAGVPAVFAALFVAVLGGASAAAMLLVIRRGAPGSAIPYGPFLAGGAVLAML